MEAIFRRVREETRRISPPRTGPTPSPTAPIPALSPSPTALRILSPRRPSLSNLPPFVLPDQRTALVERVKEMIRQRSIGDAAEAMALSNVKLDLDDMVTMSADLEVAMVRDDMLADLKQTFTPLAVERLGPVVDFWEVLMSHTR